MRTVCQLSGGTCILSTIDQHQIQTTMDILPRINQPGYVWDQAYQFHYSMDLNSTSPALPPPPVDCDGINDTLWVAQPDPAQPNLMKTGAFWNTPQEKVGWWCNQRSGSAYYELDLDWSGAQGCCGWDPNLVKVTLNITGLDAQGVGWTVSYFGYLRRAP